MTIRLPSKGGIIKCRPSIGWAATERVWGGVTLLSMLLCTSAQGYGVTAKHRKLLEGEILK